MGQIQDMLERPGRAGEGGPGEGGLGITALTNRAAKNGWMDKQAIEWVETGSLSWLRGQTMTNMGIVLVL